MKSAVFQRVLYDDKSEATGGGKLRPKLIFVYMYIIILC